MRKMFIPVLLTIFAATSAAANEGGATNLARAPSDMSSAEIDAYNQGRTANDAGYIRCRRIEVPGSLVKKLRVCNTNGEWRRIVDKGNQDARDSMETLARGWSNSQEPAGSITYTPPK